MTNNLLLKTIESILSNDLDGAKAAFSKAISQKSSMLLGERYNEDSEIDYTLEPEHTQVQLGPYTIKLKYQENIKYALGRQIYAATMTDPAEYADDAAIGFGPHDNGMDVAVESITSGGETIEIPQEFAKFKLFFEEDEKVSVETAMDDIEIGHGDTEFQYFANENKDELVSAIAQAVDANRDERRKDFETPTSQDFDTQ